MFRWSELFRLRSKPDSRDKTTSPVRLLAITASDEFYARLVDIASSSGWEIRRASTVQQGIALQRSTAMPLIVLDWDENSDDWRHGFKRLASTRNPPCMLLASRFTDDNLRQEVMRLRGYDVLGRSANREQIVRTIEFAWFWTTRSQQFADTVKQQEGRH
jgi:DNA-binding response OmpR family regulator